MLQRYIDVFKNSGNMLGFEVVKDLHCKSKRYMHKKSVNNVGIQT
jgi:hypothetical protein